MILAGCATAAAPVAPAPVATQAPITVVPTTASAPVSAPEIDVAQNSDFGSFLVDAKGMTLYLYTKDTPNTSTCYDKCAAAWPPLLTSGSATAGTGADTSKLGTTARTDGTTQVTYNGWPLYYFVKDKAAGDVTGQNVGSVWFVVSPAGDKIESKVAPTAAGASAGASASAPEIDVAQNSDLGSFLVDAKGMALYLYTKDTPNTSTCYDKCAAAWPPLLTTSNAMAGKGVDDSKFGTTKRTDGTTQVTYNGWPLYYFVKDKAAGDVTGQNVGGVWFVLSPAGDKIESMARPTQSANSNANTNSNDNGNSNSNTNSSEDALSGNVAVSISNFAFNPSPLTVKVGSTVTWTNNDSASHNVTADDGSFKSDTLAKGATFSFTFTKAGTYQYYCSFHGGPGGQGMSGIVTVTQ
jgi:predicted lipoprotein with Yx(FWY)xxD motif/plastocyanin